MANDVRNSAEPVKVAQQVKDEIAARAKQQYATKLQQVKDRTEVNK